MISPRLLAASGAGLLVLLAGCSAGSTDFKAAAEKAITGDSALGDGSSADCVEPDSTDVGTTFTCTGTDSAGTTYEFLATITAKDKVTVTAGGDAPATDDGTGDTVTEDTTGS